MSDDQYNMSMDDDGRCTRCGAKVIYKGDWWPVEGGWNRYGRCGCEGTTWLQGKFTTGMPTPDPNEASPTGIIA